MTRRAGSASNFDTFYHLIVTLVTNRAVVTKRATIGGSVFQGGRDPGLEAFQDGSRHKLMIETVYFSPGLFSGRMAPVCVLFYWRECQSCSHFIAALYLLHDGSGRRLQLESYFQPSFSALL